MLKDKVKKIINFKEKKCKKKNSSKLKLTPISHNQGYEIRITLQKKNETNNEAQGLISNDEVVKKNDLKKYWC